LDIEEVPSIRRNPILADIFHRLDFAERQGSGLRKIREETSHLYGYTDEFAPKFVSTPSAFHVILKNMNSNLDGTTMQVAMQVTTQDARTEQLIEFCSEPRSREEMQQFIGIMNREYFRKAILKPLLDARKLRMTVPDKPTSRNQHYVRV
jgi:ATP-dependent DNA helicase RecG